MAVRMNVTTKTIDLDNHGYNSDNVYNSTWDRHVYVPLTMLLIMLSVISWFEGFLVMMNVTMTTPIVFDHEIIIDLDNQGYNIDNVYNSRWDGHIWALLILLIVLVIRLTMLTIVVIYVDGPILILFMLIKLTMFNVRLINMFILIIFNRTRHLHPIGLVDSVDDHTSLDIVLN